MSTPKKPNANSVLQTLPEERQFAIISLLKEKSYEEVVKHLCDDGLTTSSGALHSFWNWWHLRQTFKDAESDTETFMTELRKDSPELSEDKIARMGNRYFNLRAIRIGDNKEWVNTQRLQQTDRQLKLDAQKFRFNAVLAVKSKWKDLSTVMRDGSLDEDAKTEALGKQLFGEDWD